MKSVSKKFSVFLASWTLALFLGWISSGCGSSSYTLINPPSGFVFTDSSGNVITSSSANSNVQLRTSDGENILFQFQVNSNVNFQNVVAARNLNNSVVHFPSNSDKAGITGTVNLFTPCYPAQNTTRVCPSATTLTDVAASCTDQILLTVTEPVSGDYAWANPTRSGINDCQIQADISNFNTGGSGTIILPYSFSFQPPPGYVGPPQECALACDDPISNLGGVEMFYQANDIVISSPASSLEGQTFAGTGTTIALDPDFISRYLDPLPSFIWTFIDDSNVTLDLYSYNYLLEGQTTPLPQCQFQCEMFPDPGATFSFSINGRTNLIAYTVTGTNVENVYFVSPANTTILLSVRGGNVGSSTMVITSTFSDDPIYPLDFTLGEGDFISVTGFEVLDLNNGVENTVTLNQSSVLTFSDTGSLQILGTDEDTVVMSDASSWTNSEAVTIDGNTFTQYQNGDATLLVQQGVNVGN